MVCDVLPEHLAEFMRMGVASTYRPRQVVFSEGNPSDALYLVCHGAVKLFHSDRFGRDHILEVATSGALLGELGSEPEAPLSSSAEAITDAQICRLQRDRLLRYLRTDPFLAVRLVEALSHELALARRKACDLALKRADSRLASLLLQLTDPSSPAPQDLDYSRRDLAEMIGVSTETVIRLLAKLKRDATIHLEGRRLTVLDPAKLARVAKYSDVASP